MTALIKIAVATIISSHSMVKPVGLNQLKECCGRTANNVAIASCNLTCKFIKRRFLKVLDSMDEKELAWNYDN